MKNEQGFNDFCIFVASLLNTVNYTLDIEMGMKYAKLISNHGSSRSVWCFVNKETGEIFKPAGWKAPAKHARGNISDKNSYEGYDWTGPHYLLSGRKAS